MSGHTVVKLDEAQQHAVEVLVGECTKAVVHVLHVRKHRAKVHVRGKEFMQETEYFQLIALMALCFRALERYPEHIQIEIDRHALTLSALMARSAT